MGISLLRAQELIGIFHSGRGLTIRHFRRNMECGVLEELEPIDQNLNYDFNFQQFVHLPREHIVKPVGCCSVWKCSILIDFCM
jgi:hypothetical protein